MMKRYPRGSFTIWILALFGLLALAACAPKHYQEGHVPPPMCRGDAARWILAWRADTNTEQWHKVSAERWADWAAGVQTVSGHTVWVRYYGGREVKLGGEAGQVSEPLHFVARCFYMDHTRSIMFITTHRPLP